MSAITPVAPVAYLDDGYQYKPSVHTGHWCGNCTHGNGGYSEKHCVGCHGVPSHPHWKRRGYSKAEANRDLTGRRYVNTKRHGKKT